MSSKIKVFFQDLGERHTYNLALPTELAKRKNLFITLGNQELHTFLKIIQHRELLKLDAAFLPIISERGRRISEKAVNILTPLYTKLLFKFDILHLNNPSSSYRRAIYSIDRPKILTWHGQNIAIENNSKRIQHVQRVLLDVDIVTAPSHFMAKVLREKIGCDPVVVYNGVDTQLFNPMIHKSYPCRSILRIPEDRKVVLWNGRLAWEKDLDTLLDAIPYVVKQFPSAFFLIKGTRARFSLRDKRFQKHVNKKIREYNLESNVMFISKYIPYERVPIYYGAADVFVHTSRLEAFGLVVAEAMACMLPVVAARTSSIPEVLGKAGLFIETGDFESLAEAVLSLLTNETFRTTLGRKAYERVRKNFTWDRAAQKFYNLYLELLAKS